MGITYSLNSKRSFSGKTTELQLKYNCYGYQQNISISGNQDYIDVYFDQHEDCITPILLNKSTSIQNSSKSSNSSNSSNSNNNSNSNSNNCNCNNNINIDNHGNKFYNWKAVLPTERTESNWGKPRYAHSMVSLGKKLIIFGGRGEGKFLDDLCVYDTVNEEWMNVKTSGEQPPPRAFHSAWCYLGKMYIYAGINGGLVLDDMYSLDSDNWVWKKETTRSPPGSQPRPRYEHKTVLVGTEVYMFGGASQYSWLNDCHILNMQTMTWRRQNMGGTAPSKRCAHSMSAHKGAYIYVFGGYNGTSRLNDLYILDIKRKRWVQLNHQNGKLPGRAAHSMITLGDSLLMTGGYDGSTKLGDIASFDCNHLEWTHSILVNSLPTRSYHTSIAIKNRVYVFGGFGADNQPLKDLYILEPSLPTLTDLCILKLYLNPTLSSSKNFLLQPPPPHSPTPPSSPLSLQISKSNNNSNNSNSSNTTDLNNIFEQCPEGLKDLMTKRKLIKNPYCSSTC
ncbi:hypothetical protein DLAC_05747 [Tieghemostelium lacteum]|uniref:Kelch repeat-containing protein n=1 Tax=Tieghemostelium lacteum TaxID=361077 RepID=A0A151ZGM5_TIELA|nr:hypothetical protein DLAC_05747 [Tieghemostelium lacteum]|eukprot:KYQ93122.1 hypothetical protein DLAC_05747 [Tieghemostelium lacteum]